MTDKNSITITRENPEELLPFALAQNTYDAIKGLGIELINNYSNASKIEYSELYDRLDAYFWKFGISIGD